jgi:hypothetical protein
MKKNMIFLLLISALQLAAGLADYEKEFGFPLDKSHHGKNYYLRELLTIAHDPQIMSYKSDADFDLHQGLIDQTEPTELDKIELSDSTLFLNVNALSDLDLFSVLALNHKLDEYEKININADEYQFTETEPADYNLYTRMEVPELLPQSASTIDFLPFTPQSKEALLQIIPEINYLSYQIDNVFLKENNILPQSGSIDFIITIGASGVEKVEYNCPQNSRFSNGFITKAIDVIKGWQITSTVRIQYTLSRQYLSRP